MVLRYFVFLLNSVRVGSLGNPDERHKFAYSSIKESDFASIARAFFIFTCGLVIIFMQIVTPA